ncbi:hypothetical protein A3A38_03405 [Candidatus Kaiserbacteria bacterium RIFCSPLOWO2_01_FULL_53_17]|uniref:N-acetyltransferase domain-containing protein n=1 Tax=Candidatus Kaiserbacteria bacterium RIFCSPLOWO2_01_FULL_53_17 TaxID=1798511 RepID=A0A1F6EHN1_9BACT|nr:MAG: hypothetical protein A3A38_03405 [Candidatus Kaiserbacteria bacterium RIFCSPLOWO2_01_FULL_53_17]
MADTEVTSLNATDLSFPLPIYTAVQIGSMRGKDRDIFDIMAGLGKALVAQVRAKSLDVADVELQENTSDRKRFGEGSYEEWYGKSRTPFALVHEATGALAALVWFGPKPLGRKSLKYLSEEELRKEGQQKETQWHTLVYRSYPPFRGKGLMGAFVRFAIQKYRERYPDVKLWVGLNEANAASVALATTLGFHKREDLVDAEARWFAMTQE